MFKHTQFKPLLSFIGNGLSLIGGVALAVLIQAMIGSGQG